MKHITKSTWKRDGVGERTEGISWCDDPKEANTKIWEVSEDMESAQDRVRGRRTDCHGSGTERRGRSIIAGTGRSVPSTVHLITRESWKNGRCIGV